MIKKIVKTIFKNKFITKPIFDLWLIERKKPTSVKKALVSYISHPFRLKANDFRHIQFSNIGIARSIVRVLNELGYMVDVVDYKDTEFIPSKNYSLFIGHGAFNFDRIISYLSSKAVKIYFSAGSYWKFNNKQEKARIDAMKKRRGVNYPYERLDINEESAVSKADVIVALGNDFVKNTYKKFNNVSTLNNAAYFDDHYDQVEKDFTGIKNNFLFFAGPGNVHKGLDLLLEAFSQIKARLYICQKINPNFYKIYQKELEDFDNIHVIGWVKMRSLKFYQIVDKCAFIIHPSCADGSPGAVIECMHRGLIPVLSRETGINTDNYGIILDTCSIRGIIKVVQDLSQRSPRQFEKMSERTRKAALKEFSESVFLGNMREVIKKALVAEN